MNTTTLERLQQHLTTFYAIPYIFVRDSVTTASGTCLFVQANRFHYCRPRDDTGPYTHVEVIHSETPPEWEPHRNWNCSYAYVPIEMVAAEIDRLGGFAEEQI